MEKKKIITENQEKRCRMIGIAGSNTGVGCTHFSIMLTNYLAGYLRRKAILLEFNESGDLEKLTGYWMRIIISMQDQRL